MTKSKADPVCYSCSADIPHTAVTVMELSAAFRFGGGWRPTAAVTRPFDWPTPVRYLFSAKIRRPALAVVELLVLFKSLKQTGSGNRRCMALPSRRNLTNR
jgi:hypothetical protein